MGLKAISNPGVVGGSDGVGDVVGPASATDNAVAKFDGTTGKLLKDGVVLGTIATQNATGLVVDAVQSPIVNGGIAANDDITIQGTTHATRTTSFVNLQPDGGNIVSGPISDISAFAAGYTGSATNTFFNTSDDRSTCLMAVGESVYPTGVYGMAVGTGDGAYVAGFGGDGYYTGSSGTAPFVIGGWVFAQNRGAGNVTDLIGLDVYANGNIGGGVVANNYGLRVADQTAGTNNWAIKTGLGKVEFGADALVPDEAYDATAWNGSLEVPTKNAIRDKIETFGTIATQNTPLGVTVGGTGLTGLTANRVLFASATDTVGTDADLTFNGTNLGVGTAAADKVLEVNLGTASAFRLTYNDANGSAATYMDTTLSSTGVTTFTGAGSAPTFNFSHAIASASLTSGRVPYATTNGQLIDDADLTFNGTTLSVDRIGTNRISDLGGSIQIWSQGYEAVYIGGGSIYLNGANSLSESNKGTRQRHGLTGSSAVSALEILSALNTSGVADVIKLAVSDTAHGTGSNLLALYGGASGTTSRFAVDTAGNVITSAPLRLKAYTVATLPAGIQGDSAFVTDALAPAFLVAVAGGGAVVTPTFYNGAAWTCA